MKLHMDLDCYFVSAERTRYPFLKGRPVVVAKGSDKRIFSLEKKEAVLIEESGAFNSTLQFITKPSLTPIVKQWRDEFIDKDGTIHGIVIAKSYETKKFKIKTGTPLKDALMMCPGLIVLPSDHLFYQMLSFKLKAYLETKIPLLEQYSIDEFFGDVGGWIEEGNTLEFIAMLQREITEKFDLPISIAASGSKWIAKLATDTIKPYGTKVIYPHEVNAFVNPIKVEDFPGVGRVVAQRLKHYGIETLEEAKRLPMLFDAYGKTGKELYKRIQGIDNEPVHPSRERKGIGISRNFAAIEDREEIQRRVMILSRYLSYTITKLGLNPTTFFMKIHYQYGTKSSKSFTHDRLFNEVFFIDLAQSMLKELDVHPRYKIHYIGLGASNCTGIHKRKSFSMLEFHKDTKHAKLSLGLMKIRDKYGVDMIGYGRERVMSV